MTKRGIVNAVVWTCILIFFLGGPMVGAVYFWNDAHAKIRGRSLDYVRTKALPLFKDWNPDRIFDEYSIDGRANFDKAKVMEYGTKFGAITTQGEPIAKRSYAKERDDNVWQFVVIESDSVFERGRAKLKFLIVHKTTSTTWQIEKLDIEPL